MPITPLPTAPSRKQSPSAFAENADAFLGHLPTFAAEATTLEQTVNAAESSAVSAKNAAQAAKAAAEAAKAAAEAVASAAAWVAWKAYTAGQCVYGTDGQTYRAMAASTGVNPVGDATGKWVQISAGGLFNNAWGRGFVNSDSAADARTSLELGTAATRNVGTASGNLMQVGAFGLGKPIYVHDADPDDLWGGLAHYKLESISPNAVSETIAFSSLIALNDAVSSHRAQLLASKDILKIRQVEGEWRTFHHTGNILTTTGQSTQFPMHQKAVTDALDAKSGLGMGQTWQNLTASRTWSVTYTNTTGKPIQVGVELEHTTNVKFYVNNIEVVNSSKTAVAWAIIPPGATYLAHGNIVSWMELR